MRHSEPFGRAPDEQRKFRRGRLELVWAKNERGLSVFSYRTRGGEVRTEIVLMNRVFHEGTPDWMCLDAFDGDGLRTREETWAWLEGGAYPRVKAL